MKRVMGFWIMGLVIAVGLSACGGEEQKANDTAAGGQMEQGRMMDGGQGMMNQEAMTQAAAGAELAEPYKSVFEAYFDIQNALAMDNMESLGESAQVIRQTAADNEDAFPPGVTEHAEAIIQAGDIEEARASFKELSAELAELLEDKQIADAGIYKMVCSMEKGGMWLQNNKMTHNPYLGMSMSKCGNMVAQY